MYINLITEKSIKENMINKQKCHVNRGFILDGFQFQGIPFFLRFTPFSGTIYCDSILSKGELERFNWNIRQKDFNEILKLDINFEIDGSGSNYRGLINRFKNLGLLVTPYDEEVYVPTNFYNKEWSENSHEYFCISWNFHNGHENRTDENLLKIIQDLNSQSEIQIVDEEVYNRLLSHSKKNEDNNRSIKIDLNYINNFIFKVTLMAKERYFFAGENDTREYEYEISDIESFIKQDF